MLLETYRVEWTTTPPPLFCFMVSRNYVTMLQSAQVQQLSHAVLAVSRHWRPASAKLKRGNWEDHAMKPYETIIFCNTFEGIPTSPISGSICLDCDNELPYRTEISCMHGIIIVLLCAYYSVSPEYGSTMIPKSLRALCTKPLQSEIRRLQSVTFGVAPPNYYILIICINLLLK